MTAQERIKRILESEENKKKDLEEKKKELEKRKLELEALEKKQAKESAEQRSRIDAEIEEMASEETRAFTEQEAIRRRAPQSLEETVSSETTTPQAANAPVGYAEAMAGVMQGSPNFYELTNYNVVNRLESLAEQARERSLTRREEEFLEIVQYHAQRMEGSDVYRGRHGSDYLRQELAKIDLIHKMAKEREQRLTYET